MPFRGIFETLQTSSFFNLGGLITPGELALANAQEVFSRAGFRQGELDLQDYVLFLQLGCSFCVNQRVVLDFEEADFVLTLFAADGDVDLEGGGLAGDRQARL